MTVDFPVPGFPMKTTLPAIDADEVAVRDAHGGLWSLGKQTQCDFLFPIDAFKLIGFDAAGNVIVESDGVRWTVTTKGERVPWFRGCAKGTVRDHQVVCT